MRQPQGKAALANGSAGLLFWSILGFLFWLALSWAADAQHLAGGAVCVVFLAMVWRNILPRTWPGLRVLAASFLYVPLLLWEVVKANVQVALIVLNPRLPIAPAFVSAQAPITTEGGRTVLANSITLTPGTLTVDVQDNIFLVHMLSGKAGLDLKGWPLTRILSFLEGR